MGPHGIASSARFNGYILGLERTIALERAVVGSGFSDRSSGDVLSRAERVPLYEIPEVQVLLRMFVDGNLAELSPEMHPVLGARYPRVEEIAGDPQKAKALLDQLVRAGILRPKFYEKMTICPSCSSKNVTFRYYCAYCGAHEIEKRDLYEHLECGAIDSDDHFLKNGKPACPRCRKPLSGLGSDYRQVGTWFQCRSCGKRFDAPEGRHYCRDCSSKFGVKESVLDDAYSYVLDKTAQTEFAREVLFLVPLKKILREAGYELETSSAVRGASGTSHTFDLVSSKTQENRRITLTLDMTISDKVCGEEHVISVFAKTFDVSPTKSILIAVPALSDTAKKLASMYKLEVIEGARPEEIAQSFHEALNRIS